MATERELLIDTLMKLTEMEEENESLKSMVDDTTTENEELGKYKRETEESNKLLQAAYAEVSILKEEKEQLIAQHVQYDDEHTQKIVELEAENEKLVKELKYVKENMRKPVKISAAPTSKLDVFEKLRKGEGCIQPLLPNNPRYKMYDGSPFTFEWGKQGAFYEKATIKGCFEREGNIRRYFHIADLENVKIGGEILYTILGCVSSEGTDCNISTKTTNQKGRNFLKWGYKKLLKLNPVFNTKLQRFVSTDCAKFIYTKPDGTRYIIVDDDKEEIL